MRVLILSGNTGGGHNSAAMAIKDYFENQNTDCNIQDALAFWSEGKSYIISNGHILIYKKAPKLFGVMYRFAENHPAKENDDSFMYDVVTRGAKGLYEHLQQNRYDAIICTHVFAGMIATEVKKKYLPQLKIYFVATDYTCSPGVSEINANGFFIPHKRLVSEFESCRVPSDKICSTGIPVREKFYKKTDSAEAKKQLGLPQNKKIVLLMCGSMGCGPIKDLTENLEYSLPHNSHLVVICGNNKHLLKELSKHGEYNRVTLVGYTDRMDLYMDAAAVALTKPGGLSTTESLTKGLPLILINAVPGCETRNLDFLTQYRFAQTGNTVDELSHLVYSYINDDKKTSEIRALLHKEFDMHAPEAMYKYIVKDCSNENG